MVTAMSSCNIFRPLHCCRVLAICHCQQLKYRTEMHSRFSGGIYNCLYSDGSQRDFSTSTANSARGDSRLQRFRRIINTFLAGSKNLGKDVKLMFEIQRKLKNSNYDWDSLKTEEIIHLHQTRKALFKSLPVVVGFFTVPFLGYAAPVIAYLYPKQLLSHHYWQPQQREKFMIQDTTKRTSFFLPLVRELGRVCIRHKSYNNSKVLLDTSVKVVNKKHPTNEELLSAAEAFKGDLLGFDHLPRYHLKKLSQVWLVSPWLPNKLLRVRLKHLLKTIRKEDAALKREGLENLHEEQLKMVCHSRGLDTTDVDPEALVQWLADWVELSSAAGDADESFLAHCAIFKAMNYDKELNVQRS